MYYLPNNPYLLIAFVLVIAYILADSKPNNRFDMKNFFSRLRPKNLLFEWRLQSIERHIRHAVDSVSFNVLDAAQKRIDFEFKYSHSSKEKKQISDLYRQAIHAKTTIENILIIESCDDHLLSKYNLQ
jgi:hypothetical protein